MSPFAPANGFLLDTPRRSPCRPDKRLTLTRRASEGAGDGIPGWCVRSLESLARASLVLGRPQIESRSCRSRPTVSSPSDDSVTPSSRIPFFTGKSDSSSGYTTSSIAACAAKGTWLVRLRVICRKSAYLALRVTVRPRMVVPSQCRQTFSTIGLKAARASSTVKRSALNVFSAPTDLRTRLAQTGRSSMPRAIQ